MADSVPEAVPDPVPKAVPEAVPDSVSEAVPDVVPDAVPDAVPGGAPNFRVRVWKYTYAEGICAGVIFLHSPQEPRDDPSTLVLRQVNSEAENLVWVEEDAPKQFKGCTEESDEPLMDDAHGVILRDGQAQTVARQDEKSRFCHYKRGDRVWVERSLAPSNNISNDGNKIPVINLESKILFWIPFDYVCFVPHFDHKDSAGDQFVANPGAVLDTFQGQRKTRSRLFFSWPATEPQNVKHMWLNLQDTEDAKKITSFDRIESVEIKRQVFQKSWDAITKRLARDGLLLGDEIIMGNADRFDSSRESSVVDSSDADLAIYWSPSPITPHNCCNLNPCPDRNNPNVDLVPTYIGGLQGVEHYHVQDDDLDECPQGSAHKGHCILRDDRTTCAYSTDRTPHTCCQLRVNPLLPGPFGDPSDARLPIWETTAGDEYFIDVSSNVRTRTELEDRDEIPPEVERLRQQMLTQEEERLQQQQHQLIDENLGHLPSSPSKRDQTATSSERTYSFVDDEWRKRAGIEPKYSIPMVNKTISFASSTKKQEPVSSVQQQEPASSVQQQEPASSTKKQKPASSVRRRKPASSVRRQEPASSVQQQEPASSTKKQEPVSSVRRRKPTSSVQQQEPAPSVQQQEPTSPVQQREPASPVQLPEGTPFGLPQGIARVYGTEIPITIARPPRMYAPPPQPYVSIYHPVSDFSVPYPEPSTDLQVAANTAPVAPMMEWNSSPVAQSSSANLPLTATTAQVAPMMDWNSYPVAQPSAFTYPQNFNFGPPIVDMNMPYDPSASSPAPPEPRTRKRSYPDMNREDWC